MDGHSSHSGHARVAWYKRRGVKAISIIITIIVLAAILAAIVALNKWNESPERRLMNAVEYALNQPGTYFISAENADADVYIDGAHYAINATVNNIPVQAVGTANTLYVKTSEPEKLLDELLANQTTGRFENTIRGIVSTIKDRWLSVNLQNQSMNFAGFEQVACVTEWKNSLSNSQGAWRVVAASYMAHPFIDGRMIRETSDDATYEMKIDATQYERFNDSVKTDSTTGSFSGCAEAQSGIVKYATDKTMTMVITKQQNKLNKLVVGSNERQAVTITTDYSTKPEIIIPKDAIGMEQITESVFSSMLQNYFQGR